MEDLRLNLAPGETIVWHRGMPPAKTPWMELTPDNPLWHPFWSWNKWGRKIVRCYLPATKPQSARPVQRQHPVPA